MLFVWCCGVVCSLCLGLGCLILSLFWVRWGLICWFCVGVCFCVLFCFVVYICFMLGFVVVCVLGGGGVVVWVFERLMFGWVGWLILAWLILGGFLVLWSEWG